MFKILDELYKDLLIKQKAEPLVPARVSNDGVVHVSSDDILSHPNAMRQINAMKRVAEASRKAAREASLDIPGAP